MANTILIGPRFILNCSLLELHFHANCVLKNTSVHSFSYACDVLDIIHVQKKIKTIPEYYLQICKRFKVDFIWMKFECVTDQP